MDSSTKRLPETFKNIWVGSFLLDGIDAFDNHVVHCSVTLRGKGNPIRYQPIYWGETRRKARKTPHWSRTMMVVREAQEIVSNPDSRGRSGASLATAGSRIASIEVLI